MEGNDDGFDLGHPDLSTAGKVVHPWDFTRRGPDPRPDTGDWHGTACAGVAVAASGQGGVVGAAVVLLVGGYNARQISVQEQRNAVLTQASADLDKKIAEIKTLKEDIAALQARQQAVEDLQGDRNQPVHLLDELVRQTPEGVQLKSVKQDGRRVTLGGAMGVTDLDVVARQRQQGVDIRGAEGVVPSENGGDLRSAHDGPNYRS